MSKKYTKTEMCALLAGIEGHLSDYQTAFPAVKGVLAALDVAIKDPTKEPTTKAAKARAVPKPVFVTVQGDEILVKGTPYAAPGHDWPKYAMARIKGVKTDKVRTDGEHAGEPVFKSAWDRKAEAFRLPKDKAPEVMAYLSEIGCPIVTA